jgi:hypothetical protein
MEAIGFWFDGKLLSDLPAWPIASFCGNGILVAFGAKRTLSWVYDYTA